MPDLFCELKIAVRYLMKSPGFALTAVLMLALGIGATTAIFSIVEGVHGRNALASYSAVAHGKFCTRRCGMRRRVLFRMARYKGTCSAYPLRQLSAGIGH